MAPSHRGDASLLRIAALIVAAILAIASPAAADHLGMLSLELIGRTLLGCLHPTGRFRSAEDIARASDGTTAEAIRAKSGADAVGLVRIAWTGAIRDKAYGTEVWLL